MFRSGFSDIFLIHHLKANIVAKSKKKKMGTKLEINVRTLIVQCEDLAKDDTNNWLLKKYIKSLDTMINELEQCEE